MFYMELIPIKSHQYCWFLSVIISPARLRKQLTVLPLREPSRGRSKRDNTINNQNLGVIHIIERSCGNSFTKETKYQEKKQFLTSSSMRYKYGDLGCGCSLLFQVSFHASSSSRPCVHFNILLVIPRDENNCRVALIIK